MELTEDSIKISDTYIPRVSTTLILKNLKDRFHELISSEPSKELKEYLQHVHVGIADAMIRNKQYRDLILDVGLDQLNNDEVLDKIEIYLFGSSSPNRNHQWADFKYSRIIENIDQNVKQLVIKKHKEGLSVRSLSSAFGAWKLQ